MLNWFRGKPTCPVDQVAKRWIESRFTWLTEEFGEQRLLTGEVVTPTTEYLPSKYKLTEDGIHDLMVRVANLMEVAPETLTLMFYEDATPQFEGAISNRTAGLYSESNDSYEIWLEVYSLEDPFNVVATLAHEIGHVILLGQKRVGADEEDHEELTDLLTVFLGLGIFPANSVLQESNWTDGQVSGWSVGKRGYLSMDMYGYAMSLYALARNEPNPVWKKHLRPDVLASFNRGVRYISETNDCEYRPALRNVK